MTREELILACIREKRIIVDVHNGRIYSLMQTGMEDIPIRLTGAKMRGYTVHKLCYNGFKKQVYAHQVVYMAAHGAYDRQAMMIDHINRDRSDNRIENLRLVDPKGNCANAVRPMGKADAATRKEMYEKRLAGVKIADLCEAYGLKKSRVFEILAEQRKIQGL